MVELQFSSSHCEVGCPVSCVGMKFSRVPLMESLWDTVMCFSLPGHQDKLGVAETKLLHTLHWMLLEAPQDCSNDRFGGDRGSSWGGSSSAFIHQAENQGSPGHPRPSTTNDEEENNRRKFFQNSMATVELFVFLFAPLVHRIKVSGTLLGYLCGDTSEQRKNESTFVIFLSLTFNSACSAHWLTTTDVLSCWCNTTDIRRESFRQHEQSLYHACRHNLCIQIYNLKWDVSVP